MMSIDVVPQYEGKKIAKLNIINISVVPFTSCHADIHFIDEDDKFVRRVTYCMTTQEYLDWMNDDTYLIEWILNKSGFQKETVSETINTIEPQTETISS